MALGKQKVTPQKQNLPEQKENSDDKSVPNVNIDDPLSSLLVLFEKKARNLEKKKQKSVQLQLLAQEGKFLNEDQKASASALDEIESSLSLLEELKDLTIDMRDQFNEIKVARSKSLAAIPQNQTNPKLIKLDTLKEVFEVQALLKGLSDNAVQLKNLQPGKNKILQPSEIDHLLQFHKFLKEHENSCNIGKLKNSARAFTQFCNKEQVNVSADLPVTYAYISTLMAKLKTTLFIFRKEAAEKKVAKTPVIEDKVEKVIKVVEEKPQNIVMNDKVASPRNDDSHETSSNNNNNNNSSRRYAPNKIQPVDQIENEASKKVTTPRPVINDKKPDEPVSVVKKTTGLQVIVTDVPVSKSNWRSGGENRPSRKREYNNSGRAYSRKERNQQAEAVASN